jgi:hypothetical protein
MEVLISSLNKEAISDEMENIAMGRTCSTHGEKKLV